MNLTDHEIDKNGLEHKGLITLRNSWGENAGDKGNFYMSYDYFDILGLGVHRIKKNNLLKYSFFVHDK